MTSEVKIIFSTDVHAVGDKRLWLLPLFYLYVQVWYSIIYGVCFCLLAESRGVHISFNKVSTWGYLTLFMPDDTGRWWYRKYNVNFTS